MKKRKPRPRSEKPRMCDPGMCDCCQYIGEGDFICDKGPGQPVLVVEALDAKVNTLIKVLKFIIAESGFELAARIELRDRKTGRFFR